jgi:flagellar motor switch protein FliN
MSGFLAQQEKTIFQNLLDLWANSNQEVLKTILNRRLVFSSGVLADLPAGKEITEAGEKSYLVFPLSVSTDVMGSFYLVFSKRDLAFILDLIIGGDGTSPMTEFDKLHMSVLEESINQLAGSLEAILTDNLPGEVNVRMGKPEESLGKLFQSYDMVCSSHKISIDEIKEIKIQVLIPRNFSRDLVKRIIQTESQTSAAAESEIPKTQGIMSIDRVQGGFTTMHRKANFPQLNSSEGEKIRESKLELLMDIPLELTIVLGKTHINVKDLVEMGPGAIIELDQLAGEPVEILVNDRLVGYGEVIVVEENFGVRVIDVTDGRDQVSGGKNK